MVQEITPTELKQKMDAGEEIQIIDVREQNERDFAKIPNSKLIPSGEILNRIKELNPTRPAVLHCHGGGRSSRAIEALKKAGYDGELLNLKGGITAWSDEVNPNVPKY